MTYHSPTSDILVVCALDALPNGHYLCVIISDQRVKDIALWETAWQLMSCDDHCGQVTCATIGETHVTYAEPPPQPSAADLIRWSAQSLVNMTISPTPPVLPCLIASSGDLTTTRQTVRVRLRLGSWADTVDFQASQAYWLSYYRNRIAEGDTYLSGRLDDYERERVVASQLPIGVGAILPVSFVQNGKRSFGCLRLLTSKGEQEFVGFLVVTGSGVGVGETLERTVRWTGESGVQVLTGAVCDVLGMA